MHCVSIAASVDIYIGFRKLKKKQHLYLINKVVSTFKGRPLLHLIQFFFIYFGESIAGCDEISVSFHTCYFITTQYINKCFINTFTVLGMEYHDLQKCIRQHQGGLGCKEENPAPLWLLATIWYYTAKSG